MNNITDIQKAALMYLQRKAGFEHPQGHKDNGGRFIPKGRDMEVMADVRAPSRAYPWSYYKACCSMKHCAAYFNVDDMKAVRKATKSGVLALVARINEAEGVVPAPLPPMNVDEVDLSFFTDNALSFA